MFILLTNQTSNAQTQVYDPMFLVQWFFLPHHWQIISSTTSISRLYSILLRVSCLRGHLTISHLIILNWTGFTPQRYLVTGIKISENMNNAPKIIYWIEHECFLIIYMTIHDRRQFQLNFWFWYSYFST